MRITATSIPDVLIVEPTVFNDDRGFLFESFNEPSFAGLTGRIAPQFVQDNRSCSAKNVLRGLHYQIKRPQGKLVRVIAGEVFDISIDLRRNSATFGQWGGVMLSGFLVISDFAESLYKTTDYWVPEYERSILRSDPEIGIEWPLQADPGLAQKDRDGKRLAEAGVFD